MKHELAGGNHRHGRRRMEGAYLYIHKDSPANAEKWRKRLLKKIATLEKQPHRCPLAAESEWLGIEWRELLFGKRRGSVFRILFEIRNDVVYVLHIRHAAQDFLQEL